MLAFTPQSLPSLDFLTSTNPSASSMSLAVLAPPQMTYSQSALPTLYPSSQSPSKRPKLALNTSDAGPVFEKGSTSLRLDTLSATSPTARNTFRNGYSFDRLAATTLQKPSLARLETNITTSLSETPTTLQRELPESTDMVEETSSFGLSATSISPVDSLTPEQAPYKVPYHMSSILRNGPIPRRRRSLAVTFAQSKPMFPSAKRVSFGTPLTEDIKTTIYTMKNSDLDSLYSATEQDGATMSFEENQAMESNDRKAHVSTPPPPQLSGKREFSSGKDGEDSNENCLTTPIAGRRKRHRQWRWTLGPIDLQTQPMHTD